MNLRSRTSSSMSMRKCTCRNPQEHDRSGDRYWINKEGISLDKVAKKFKAKPENIQEWNNIQNPKDMIKGQALLVCKGS